MEYAFYREVYGGTVIPEGEFAQWVARALDELAGMYCRYAVEVRPTVEDGPEKAACAMAEELYRYARAADEARSVSVGSVRCGAGVLPSAAGHRRALLRCCERYLKVYRGAGGAR